MYQAKHPVAIHPGEILREEFMGNTGITQAKLAASLGIPIQRVNLLLNEKRRITPDTAYRLARFFGTSVELWMGLQQDWDIREARDAGIERDVAKIRPLKRSA
jgi:antitoxin HigA-1